VRSGLSFRTRGQRVSPVLGGLFALVYPAILVVVALGVGFRRGGDMGEFAATLAATLMFLIAAPTAWILSFEFIDVTRFTVLVFGIVTSLPIWYIAGVAIARRSPTWTTWFRRYAIGCVAWTAGNLLVIGIVAAIVG
jgi:hypothetical protein